MNQISFCQDVFSRTLFLCYEEGGQEGYLGNILCLPLEFMRHVSILTVLRILEVDSFFFLILFYTCFQIHFFNCKYFIELPI